MDLEHTPTISINQRIDRNPNDSVKNPLSPYEGDKFSAVASSSNPSLRSSQHTLTKGSFIPYFSTQNTPNIPKKCLEEVTKQSSKQNKNDGPYFAYSQSFSKPTLAEPQLKKKVKLNDNSEHSEFTSNEFTEQVLARPSYVCCSHDKEQASGESDHSCSSHAHSIKESEHTTVKTCAFGHDTTMDASGICSTCEKRLESLRVFAAGKAGRLVSQQYSEKITFSCEFGHEWTYSYKSARKRWCPHCRKDERLHKQDMKEQIHKEREAQYVTLQKKLFEDAKREAEEKHKKEQAQKPVETPRPNRFVVENLQKLQDADSQTDNFANIFAQEFLRTQPAEGCTLQQAVVVYKYLFISDNYFELLMSFRSPDELKAFFKSTLKQLHPDKNRHPDTTKAFQKVYHNYKVFLSYLARLPAAN